MAKTLKELEAEFKSVSKLTTEAYDDIYGRGSGRGLKGAGSSLDEKYKIAVRDYRNNPDKSNKEILDAAKSEWEKRQAVYRKYQEQKNTLQKELKAAQKEADKAKKKEAEQKLVLSGYQKALDKLNDAELELGTYKGDTKYIQAYQEAQAAFENAKESGATPKPLPKPKITVPTPEKKEEKKPAGEEETPAEVTNIDEFRNILADPKNKQLLIDIQKDLIKNFGWTGKADGRYGLSFQDALGKAASARDQLPESLRGKDLRSFIKNPGDVELGLGAGGTAGTTGPVTTTRTDIDRMTKGQIASDIDARAQKVLERELTAEDKQQDWYKDLVGSIKKMVEKGVISKTTTSATGKNVKDIRTPGFAQEDINALIDRRLKMADPESLARKERIDFYTWMNNALGDR